MSTTIIGSNIKIDVTNSKGKLNIGGNNEQETREGYNLFDYENCIVSSFYGTAPVKQDNGVLGGWGYTIKLSQVLPAGTYYFSLKISNSDAGGNLGIRDSNNNVIKTIGVNKLVDKISFSFTTDTDFSAIRIDAGVQSITRYIYDIQIVEGTEEKPYEAYGVMPSPDFRSEVKTVKDKVNIFRESKNIFPLPESETKNGIIYTKNSDGTFNLHGTSTDVTTFVVRIPQSESPFKVGKYYTFSVNFIVNTSNTPYFQVHDANGSNWISTKIDIPVGKNVQTKEWTATKGTNINFIISIGKGKTIDYDNIKLQLEEEKENTYFESHQRKQTTIPIQEEMLEEDTFVKENGVWYEKHTWGKVVLDGTEEISRLGLAATGTYRYLFLFENCISVASSGKIAPILCNVATQNSRDNMFSGNSGIGYTNDNKVQLVLDNMKTMTLSEFKAYLKEQYDAGTPIIIYYKLATPKLLPCTQDQKVVLKQMQNIILYNGVNNIYSTDEISPIFTLIYDKIINDFELYLSENGHLIIPEYDINFLVDLIESNIPSMPEAAESNVRVAGRDGDIPLNTTYEPIPFELVCYTDDNLTAKEKLIEEDKVTKFLNSIKNKTKTFAMEFSEKFYKIKYSGALTTEKYPAHIKFTIPLKSSDSYAKNWIESFIIGNGTAESDTIKETGAIFTIDGPAISPKISLNDYIMEYENILLSGEQLIINSSNSTATLVNSSGTATNAMAYYNHEFPKIQNGTNELKVLSGIDNENQVQVKWYDLKL